MSPQERPGLREGQQEGAVDQGCGWITMAVNASQLSLSVSVS